MNHLEEIKRLEILVKQLELENEEHISINKEIDEYLFEFLNSLSDKKGFEQDFLPSELIFEKKINENGYSLKEILSLFEKAVNTNGIQPASGGHLGYIPGGGVPLAAYGDFIAAMTNKYSGIYYANPGAINIENHLLNWCAEVFDFDTSTYGGNLTTGGSIANLISIVAARDKHEIKGKNYEKTVNYGSEQMHHCLYKAIRISGLEECIFRMIPLDDKFHIDTLILNEQIIEDQKNGLNPFLIIASAGTTDTGVIDDLEKLSLIANTNNCWLHVDAAYGGFFYLLKEKKAKFKGIEKADSLVIDPHKGLFLPYGSGVVLIKDKKDLLHSNHYLANYMQDAYKDQAQLSPADLSPELSRNFRGMRMWLPLMYHGIEAFKNGLKEKLLLTQYAYEELNKLEFIELGPFPELSVFTFRFIKDKVDINDLNKEMIVKLHKDGKIFISSTSINNNIWLRVAILSFRTHKREVDILITMVKKHFSEHAFTTHG